MYIQKLATSIGLLSVLLWSFSAVCMTVLINIPVAQTIGMALGVSFVLGIIKITYQGRWYQMKQPAIIWLFGVLGILGNNFAYIGATKYAPIEHVSLIVALSPLFLIIFATLLTKEAFKLKYLLSACIGLIGVYILITQKNGFGFVTLECLPGYILAILAALTWASYTLSLRYYKAPIDMVSIFCGITCVFAAVIHFNFETTVMPTTEQWFVIALLGTMMLWLAYYFWAFGVMHGNIQLLSLYLYTIPVFSLIWLVLFGKSTLTPSLAIATIFIVTSLVLANPCAKKNISDHI